MTNPRRIVKLLVNHHEKANWTSTTGLRQVGNCNYPLWLRCVWLMVFVASLVLCSYQTYNRVMHYMSGPVAVDVRIAEVHRFPSFTVCSQDTQAFINFKKNHSTGVGGDFACMNQILHALNYIENVDVGQLWKMVNTKDIVTTAVLKRLKNITKIIPKEINTPMGLCSVFHLEEEMSDPTTTQFILKLAKLPEGCEQSLISGSAHEPGELAIDIRNLFGFSPFQIFYITLGYKQYIFLNSTRNPCVDHKTYNECQNKCLLKMYEKYKFPCRFPFMPEGLKLKFCKTKQGVTKDLYTKAITTYIRTNPTEDCNCQRRCNKIVFEFSLANKALNQNETTFHMFLSHKHILSVEERVAYDFISLLADFGGNLGLYFGLSILSAIYYLQKYISLFKSRAKVKNFQRRHPKAFKFVSDIFNREIKKREKKVLFKFKFHGVAHGLVSSSLFFITVCLLTIRISYYISEPTRVVINVLENSTMNFPSLTLCYESKKFAQIRKKQYRALGRAKDYCKANFWDFFDGNMSANDIWAFKSSSDIIMNNTEQFATTYVGIVPIKAEEHTAINTPTGQCTHFKIGKHQFVGTATLFGFIVMRKQCKQYATAYITEKDLEPDIIHQIPVVIGGISAILLTAKEISYYNSTKNPCVRRESFLSCRAKCLNSKLNKLRCRLPYMKNILLPMCSSSHSARLAQYTFIKAYLDLKTCNCIKPCTSNIFALNWYYEPRDVQQTMFFTNFVHNTLEYIHELPHYTYIQLLCDIGAILSVTLGLCIPVIFLLLQNISFSTVDLGFALEVSLPNLMKFGRKL